MRNKRFPKYPDDTDYTTNSPSYYDDLAKKQKLIEMLAKKIWEYEETLDLTLEEITNRLESYIEENDNLLTDRLEQWDLNLEKFPENVELLLREWLSDGTIFDTKADITYVDSEIDRLEQKDENISMQLTQKVSKNQGEVTPSDLSQEVKEQMTGGSVAVVGKNTVLEENIVDGQVSAKKTNFFKDMVEVNEVDVLIDKGFGTTLVDGYNIYNKLVQLANNRTLVIPVTENEELYLTKEPSGHTSRLGFSSSYPTEFPFEFYEPTFINPYPAEIKVPNNAKYMFWHISNTSVVPDFNIYRRKIQNELIQEPDIFEWSENIFTDQFLTNTTLNQTSGRHLISANANSLTVSISVKAGEVYKLSKNGGTKNVLGFTEGSNAIGKDTTPQIEPIDNSEITVPKGMSRLLWTVSDDNVLPDITIQKKIFKHTLIADSNANENEIAQYPTITKPNTSFGGIIEHEWRSTKNHVYATPKIFSVDGSNAIFSSKDYGQSWKKETQLTYKPKTQHSNMGHRMIFQQATNYNRDGVVRIYTDDYKLVSEYSGIWPGYNENGADGKPGVDGTWVFAEYVSTPQGGNLGLGVRVMQTKNNGLTWNEILHLDDVNHFHSCRYDPYNPDHIYVNTGDATDEMRNRWYASYDDGETWEHLGGGVLNNGRTPLIDGTFTHDKYMRTTALVMGVDSGEKGRNSIFYMHDNIGTALVRYDKTLKKFQIIKDNLEGVAYCTTLTQDGVYTITQDGGLHYIIFPTSDDDIDDPTKYETHTVKLPKNGYTAMAYSSRQIDLAGNSIIGSSITYYNKMGRNLTNNRLGGSLGLKVNFAWGNDSLGDRKLSVITNPIMPIF